MDKIEALPKEDSYIKVDFAKKKVMKMASSLDLEVKVMSEKK